VFAFKFETAVMLLEVWAAAGRWVRGAVQNRRKTRKWSREKAKKKKKDEKKEKKEEEKGMNR
jgi:hypothetical protein